MENVCLHLTIKKGFDSFYWYEKNGSDLSKKQDRNKTYQTHSVLVIKEERKNYIYEKTHYKTFQNMT